MKKNAQISCLKWFLDFINADLGTLSLGEIMKLTTDTLTIIYGLGPLLFTDQGKTLLPGQRWENGKSMEDILGEWRKGDKLKACQSNLKNFINDLLEQVKATRDQIKEGRKPIPELENFFCFAQLSLSLNINMRIETPILKWEDRERERDDVTAHISEEALLKAPIHLAFKAPNDEDTLLFYFCQALEGLPFGSLKSCDDIKCNNWFVHVSKRERKYCSQKCGMRTANRERRKRIKIEDPEKYKHELKEGRKRAKKSQKKIRAKHGKK